MPSQTPPTSAHYHYAVYGQALCSSIYLPELPAQAFEIRDIRFEHHWRADQGLPFEPIELIDRRATNLNCDISVHRTAQGYLLEWDGLCRFHVLANGQEIVSSARPEVGYGWVSATLYGMVLSFALHVKGIHNLHSSAVSLPSGAVAFLANPGSGKSSIAAAFAAHGYPFLTDDVLALGDVEGHAHSYQALPGFPFASLSAQASEYVHSELGRSIPLNQEKSRIAIDGEWATFAREPQPLQGLFILDRSLECTTVKTRRLPWVQSVQALMEHTNVLPLLPVELQRSQLAFVSRLAEDVRVWQITYPSGFEHLPMVVDTVTDLIAVPVG